MEQLKHTNLCSFIGTPLLNIKSTEKTSISNCTLSTVTQMGQVPWQWPDCFSRLINQATMTFWMNTIFSLTIQHMSSHSQFSSKTNRSITMKDLLQHHLVLKSWVGSFILNTSRLLSAILTESKSKYSRAVRILGMFKTYLAESCNLWVVFAIHGSFLDMKQKSNDDLWLNMHLILLKQEKYK